MASNESYASLTTVQQGKLMQAISEVRDIEDPEQARNAVWELKVFLDMLEAYKFITPTAQTRYVEGLNSAFEGRRKQKK